MKLYFIVHRNIFYYFFFESWNDVVQLYLENTFRYVEYSFGIYHGNLFSHNCFIAQDKSNYVCSTELETVVKHRKLLTIVQNDRSVKLCTRFEFFYFITVFMIKKTIQIFIVIIEFIHINYFYKVYYNWFFYYHNTLAKHIWLIV